MDLKLTGKIALVTGASRGIGLAIAEGLAVEGVRVAIAARSSEPLNAAAGALTKAGHEVLAHPCDVSDEAAVKTLVDSVLARFGRIDILISNASAMAIGPDRSSWDASLAVDLMGAVRLVEAVLPGMRKQGSGSILFTSSVSAVEASPMSDFGYTAAKAGLNAYAKKLAGTEAPNGIRVNALMPGSIEFPGGDWEKVRQHQPGLYGMVQNSIPFGRLGTPAEVADAAVWLVSPRANWVTGVAIAVDGGQAKGIR
jgi:3-oxoacyl-[acyl-carrier protein] reductase